MPLLELDTEIAFGDFDLEIQKNLSLEGITALFGPSGGGKSTLLRIIAGIETKSVGEIKFDEEIWQSANNSEFVPPHRRGVGFVFQNSRLFAHLNVAGNLRYAERRSKGQNDKIDLEGVIATLELSPLLQRKPVSLSGGEIQRVAIARALLSRPRLLLMDEPLAALDFKRKARILPLIEKLPITFGIPAIYVTHAIDEAARLATRMAVLANGRIKAEGPVGDVMARHDIQSIIGRFEAASLINARISSHDEVFHLSEVLCGETKLVMPQIKLAIGTEIRLRIRARDISLALTRPEGTSIQNVLSGTIVEIVEEKETAFAEVMIGVNGAKLRVRITRKSAMEMALEIGQPVFALIKSISFDRRALG